jgi:hypothetical protein
MERRCCLLLVALLALGSLSCILAVDEAAVDCTALG